MSTALIIMDVIVIFGLNLFSARMISDWLNPKENLLDVWVPRVSLVPPLGIIVLLIACLVTFITIIWWAIKDIWE
jgi:hypothetical protein